MTVVTDNRRTIELAQSHAGTRSARMAGGRTWYIRTANSLESNEPSHLLQPVSHRTVMPVTAGGSQSSTLRSY